MSQNDSLPYNNQPVLITPTLVICMGKFGRAVGVQLAARLLLLEAALKQEGYANALIARKDKYDVVPGLVRIMHLNWEGWLADHCDQTKFLQDIEEIQDVSVAQKDIYRWILEPETPQTDVDWISEELKNIDQEFLLACLPLRLHAANLHKGINNDMRLRVVIVCAAREASTARLTHDFVKIMGRFYRDHDLTPGIQMFCYIGGTLLDEHESAGGARDHYFRDDYYLPKLERTRVMGRRAKGQDAGLLESLMYIWNDDVAENAQLLETCYLIDAHLQNRLVPMPRMQDNPSEIVVATALALMAFITTDADLQIRQTLFRRTATPVPGKKELKHCAFASLGIASYSVDHPRLHWLVHSWLLGDFLYRALPPSKSELYLPGSPLEVADETIAQQVKALVQGYIRDYRAKIEFDAINTSIDQSDPSRTSIPYAQLIKDIDKQGGITQQELRTTLTHIATSRYTGPLLQHLQHYQQKYRAVLREVTQTFTHHVCAEQIAPLTCSAAFLHESYQYIERQVAALDKLDPKNAAHGQQLFASRLEKLYQQAELASVSALEERMDRRPTRINTLPRALLILVAAIAAFPPGLPLFIALGAASVAAIVLGESIYLFHVFMHRRSIRRELEKLAHLLEEQLYEAHRYIHQWAWLEFKEEFAIQVQHVSQLCLPKGVIATLRDELVNQDLHMKDNTLERLFLDDQLKQNLKQVMVDDSIERQKLWNRHERILVKLLDNQHMSITEIKKMLRDEVEELYKGNTARISDIISSFLAQRKPHRLDEIYKTLFNAAIPFLQYKPDKQDDSVAHLELFAVSGKQDIDKQDITTQYPHTTVINSLDKLHWIFMRVHAGIHFDQINFSIEKLVPP